MFDRCEKAIVMDINHCMSVREHPVRAVLAFNKPLKSFPSINGGYDGVPMVLSRVYDHEDPYTNLSRWCSRTFSLSMDVHSSSS